MKARMTQSRAPWLLAAAAAMLAVSCGDQGKPGAGPWTLDDPEQCSAIAECDASLTVEKGSPALLVNDPEALAGLQLEDVLEELLYQDGNSGTSPTELLQRLFDTNNRNDAAVFKQSALHCDSYANPAHVNGPAAFCPRAEGGLATSDGLFTPGHPDSFVPVAAVNRFDLTPFTAETCGEARIVYAKTSGLGNPDDRVFVIFEASIRNPEPGCLLACRPVMEFWKSLEQETSAAAVATRLHDFFFEGLPGFGPTLQALNLGSRAAGSSYYEARAPGQIRVSQHMEEHWELRQMRLTRDGGWLHFAPALVGNNPSPILFDPAQAPAGQGNDDFQTRFLEEAASPLAALAPGRFVTIAAPADLSGESALGGEPLNDYAARGSQNGPLLQSLQSYIDQGLLPAECPPDDPLTPISILQRATMMSCAGCHAPSQLLGPERRIGCGMIWPDSLDQVHIDERGKLSPALKEVFLPQRAAAATTYLQACDEDAIDKAFGGPGAGTKTLRRGRTLGGAVTH